ncbi:MAG: hypothetical protein B6226_04095 [Candidatus Cloacimonetes bacterium 4572_65]|nr:MAG: hypothetical protein B6226_04095 [Candidatus Cloacimonetes bacterium 4572_65]
MLDKDPIVSEGDDAVTLVRKSIKPNPEFAMPQPDSMVAGVNITPEMIQVIKWDKANVDSLNVYSTRKNYSISKIKTDQWNYRSSNISMEINKANDALFKLLNVFEHFKSASTATKDYSNYSKYFENPVCTVTAFFDNGKSQKISFIRIAKEKPTSLSFKNPQMDTYVRVDNDSVIYATTYNILARFLVSEKTFTRK